VGTRAADLYYSYYSACLSEAMKYYIDIVVLFLVDSDGKPLFKYTVCISIIIFNDSIYFEIYGRKKLKNPRGVNPALRINSIVIRYYG